MKSCQTELECGHLYYFRLNHCAVRSISQTMATENLGFYEADVFMDKNGSYAERSCSC